VYEIRDTPSFNRHLKSPSRGDRPVVFFDTPEVHVRALAMDAKGVRLQEASLGDFADLLGGMRSGEQQARISGIRQQNFAGKESVLEATKPADSRARELIRRISGREMTATWNQSRVIMLDRAATERLVEGIGWNAETDGIPTAAVLQQWPARLQATNVSVVAGFGKSELAAGEVTLRAIQERNLKIATQKQASVAQYGQSVRDELKLTMRDKLKRFLLIIKSGETETLLSFEPAVGGDIVGGE
jgi:hypothetical protein